MKKFLLAASVASLSIPAMAADLPAKARPIAAVTDPCTVATAATPLSCTGAYVGGGLAGQGSNADIIGSGVSGSVFAGGMTPTIDAGYLYAKGNIVFGAEFDVGYSFATKAAANTVGNSFNGFRITEDFQAGGNLSGLLGTQTPITIPASLANSVIAPYIHVGTTQWQLPGAWANGVESGAGVWADLGPRIMANLKYTYTNFSSARAGGLIINDDNSLMVTINYKLN
jgi:opacity protein-like surface antigen